MCVDVIVLAGDIHVGDRAAREAVALSERFPCADIVWIAGNHEFYRRDIDDQLKAYRSVSADHPRVHFLEDESVEIRGVTFLGCVLWTDFSLLGEPDRSIALADRVINDFYLIKTAQGRQLTAQDAELRFQTSRSFLEEALSMCEPDQTVVVTHFAPGLETVSQNFDLSDITPYFQADVIDLIDRYQPSHWIFGHNHYSNDLMRGRTRLISNQGGYPSELGTIPAYDPTRVVVVDGGTP
ncbi:MAG: metallophosphoesterase [Spongiibacteraceae bacterium]|jgi:Icc-related predicted phosphoesterase|nr:metallophosphoesterase [Spongiibacteraceae bacterium]